MMVQFPLGTTHREGGGGDGVRGVYVSNAAQQSGTLPGAMNRSVPQGRFGTGEFSPLGNLLLWA